MWPYPWTHVGTPSHLGHMDRVAATMPSQAHAGAAQEAPDIGQWEGQDVPLVRPSSCNVKGGIPSSRIYLPTYLPFARLGGCDGSGPGFRAFGRSGARCRVPWRPSASGLFGDFRAEPGMAPRGGGSLGNGFRWQRRWPGGQARRVVWRAGLLGCCGCRRCRCADACGVVRGCVCAGLGFG